MLYRTHKNFPGGLNCKKKHAKECGMIWQKCLQEHNKIFIDIKVKKKKLLKSF